MANNTTKNSTADILCLSEYSIPENISLWITVGSLAIINNFILFSSLIFTKSAKRSSNIIITSSFFIGILFGALYILPLFSSDFFINIPLICSMLPIIGLALLSNYNLHQCLISVDRYIAVRWPIKYRDINNRKFCIAIVLLTWIISFTTAAIPIMTFRQLSLNECILGYNVIDEANFFLVYHLVLFIVPTSIIVYCYCYIYHYIYKKKRTIFSQQAFVQVTEISKLRSKTNQAAIQMSILAIIFIAMIFPFLITFQIVLFSFQNIDSFCSLPTWFRNYFAAISRYIAFSYPAVNPLLYGYFLDAIREVLHSRYKYLTTSIMHSTNTLKR
ncbi:Ocellar opsin [Trichoplax sp. H2]|nr:Ocellar opsin [Trichoplax sp. H2]|eukprot:RDD38798.1 Ocellar opsin [Trichoplax sp. H2]